MSSSESDQVKLAIIHSGAVWKTKVNINTKISKLVSSSLSHFLGSGSNPSRHLKYKAVLVRTRTVLLEKKSLAEVELKDNDEIILAECRSYRPEDVPQDTRGPTSAEIYEATKHLQKRNTLKDENKAIAAEDLDYTERFSKDSLRIFVSLVETASRILTVLPAGIEVFNTVNNEMKSKMEASLNSPFVKQLTDMGFPERMVLKALKVTKMNVSNAADWLIENSTYLEQNEEEDEPSTSSSPPTVFDAFQSLLKRCLKKRHDNLKVNFKHVQKLKQMGYDEQMIENALQETDNNLNAAVSWLSGKGGLTSHKLHQHGLDPDGSMYKALMADQLIQLNLRKPKFLIGILSILEDPHCLGLWLKDCDIGTVLNQIVLIHSTETSGGRDVV